MPTPRVIAIPCRCQWCGMLRATTRTTQPGRSGTTRATWPERRVPDWVKHLHPLPKLGLNTRALHNAPITSKKASMAGMHTRIQFYMCIHNIGKHTWDLRYTLCWCRWLSYMWYMSIFSSLQCQTCPKIFKTEGPALQKIPLQFQATSQAEHPNLGASKSSHKKRHKIIPTQLFAVHPQRALTSLGCWDLKYIRFIRFIRKHH